MDERLKSVLHMAIGLASTSDKARRLLEKMSIEGKLSEDEGKRILNELLHAGSETGSQLKEDVKSYVDNLFLELQLPSKLEMQQLKERIEKLENEIKQLKGV